MRIKELSAHLIQVTKWPVVFPMNCYVVQEEDGLTLVDSTTSSPAGDIRLFAYTPPVTCATTDCVDPTPGCAG